MCNYCDLKLFKKDYTRDYDFRFKIIEENFNMLYDGQMKDYYIEYFNGKQIKVNRIKFCPYCGRNLKSTI